MQSPQSAVMQPGVLLIRLERAFDLKDMDLLHKQDPYCVLMCGHVKILSSIHKRGGKNPVWNEEFKFAINQEDTLRIKIKDKDRLLQDDFIGEARLDLVQARQRRMERLILPVMRKDFKRKEKQHGTIQLTVHFQPDARAPSPQPPLSPAQPPQQQQQQQQHQQQGQLSPPPPPLSPAQQEQLVQPGQQPAEDLGLLVPTLETRPPTVHQPGPGSCTGSLTSTAIDAYPSINSSMSSHNPAHRPPSSSGWHIGAPSTVSSISLPAPSFVSEAGAADDAASESGCSTASGPTLSRSSSIASSYCADPMVPHLVQDCHKLRTELQYTLDQMQIRVQDVTDSITRTEHEIALAAGQADDPAAAAEAIHKLGHQMSIMREEQTLLDKQTVMLDFSIQELSNLEALLMAVPLPPGEAADLQAAVIRKLLGVLQQLSLQQVQQQGVVLMKPDSMVDQLRKAANKTAATGQPWTRDIWSKVLGDFQPLVSLSQEQVFNSIGMGPMPYERQTGTQESAASSVSTSRRATDTMESCFGQPGVLQQSTLALHGEDKHYNLQRFLSMLDDDEAMPGVPLYLLPSDSIDVVGPSTAMKPTPAPGPAGPTVAPEGKDAAAASTAGATAAEGPKTSTAATDTLSDSSALTTVATAEVQTDDAGAVFAAEDAAADTSISKAKAAELQGAIASATVGMTVAPMAAGVAGVAGKAISGRTAEVAAAAAPHAAAAAALQGGTPQEQVSGASQAPQEESAAPAAAAKGAAPAAAAEAAAPAAAAKGAAPAAAAAEGPAAVAAAVEAAVEAAKAADEQQRAAARKPGPAPPPPPPPLPSAVPGGAESKADEKPVPGVPKPPAPGPLAAPSGPAGPKPKPPPPKPAGPPPPPKPPGPPPPPPPNKRLGNGMSLFPNAPPPPPRPDMKAKADDGFARDPKLTALYREIMRLANPNNSRGGGSNVAINSNAGPADASQLVQQLGAGRERQVQAEFDQRRKELEAWAAEVWGFRPQSMSAVEQFVALMESRLNTLQFEREVQKKLEDGWPEARYDTYKLANAEYKKLQSLKTAAETWKRPTSVSNKEVLQKIQEQYVKLVWEVDNYNRTREAVEKRFKEAHVPWPGAALIDQVKKASMHLVRAYLTEAMKEVRSLPLQQRQPANMRELQEHLLVEAVQFAYKAQVFVSGLDPPTRALVHECGQLLQQVWAGTLNTDEAAGGGGSAAAVASTPAVAVS